MSYELLTILATYGILSLILLAIDALSWWRPKASSPMWFILLLKDSEQKLEHVVRALSWMSRIKGIPIRFIAVDYGSRDDTLSILERLSDHGQLIEVAPPGKEGEEGRGGALEAPAATHVLIDLREGRML